MTHAHRRKLWILSSENKTTYMKSKSSSSCCYFVSSCCSSSTAFRSDRWTPFCLSYTCVEHPPFTAAQRLFGLQTRWCSPPALIPSVCPSWPRRVPATAAAARSHITNTQSQGQSHWAIFKNLWKGIQKCRVVIGITSTSFTQIHVFLRFFPFAFFLNTYIFIFKLNIFVIANHVHQ